MKKNKLSIDVLNVFTGGIAASKEVLGLDYFAVSSKPSIPNSDKVTFVSAINDACIEMEKLKKEREENEVTIMNYARIERRNPEGFVSVDPELVAKLRDIDLELQKRAQERAFQNYSFIGFDPALTGSEKTVKWCKIGGVCVINEA